MLLSQCGAVLDRDTAGKNKTEVFVFSNCTASFHPFVAPRRFFLLCEVSPCPPWSEESVRLTDH